MARNRSKLPGLEVPTNIDPGLRALLEAVKERLELMSGERGDPNARALTVTDSASLTSSSSAADAEELDLSLLTRLPFEAVQPDYKWLVQGSSIADRYSVSVGDLFEAFTSPYETESVSATWTFSNADVGLQIKAIVPRIRMTELADEDSIDSLDSDMAYWDHVVEGGAYSLRLRDDEDSLDTVVYEATRVGMTATLVDVQTTGLQHNGSQVITEAGAGLTKTFNTLDPDDFTITLSTDLSGAVSIVDLSSATLAATITSNAISDAKLRDSVALSVIGRRENSSGDPADIVAAANNTVLRRVDDALDFGSITSGYISDFAEASRDVVGSMFQDNSEIDFSYDDSLDATDSVDSIGGVTARIVRSINPTWTGTHFFDPVDAITYFGVSPATVAALPSGLSGATIKNESGVECLREANVPFFVGVRIQGTYDSPTAAPSGINLFVIQGRSYDGTAIGNAGNYSILTNEAWSSTAHGSRANVSLCLNGSTTATEHTRFASGASFSLQTPDGTAAIPGQTFLADTDTGRRRIGANNMADVCGGTDVVDYNATRVAFAVCPRLPSFTVATLPAAATVGAGAVAYVTDANAPAFGAAVAGGGAVGVPVYSTGAAWNVG